MPRATVEEVAKRVLLDANMYDAKNGDKMLLAADWIYDRYVELVRTARFRQTRKLGYLTLPAYVETGTITATRGSAVVVGNAAAQAAWAAAFTVGLSLVVDGWFFRTRTAWYELDSIVGANMTLKSSFGEETAAAGSTYKLVKRNHLLGISARWLGEFVHTRRLAPLTRMHLDQLNASYPSRPAIGGNCSVVAEVGMDDDKTARIVEIYPPAKEVEVIAYTYWEDIARLELTDYFPAFLDVDLLKYGAMVNAYQHKAVMMADAGKLEAAAMYSNWAQRQNTMWKNDYVQQAIASDRGLDDIAFILGSIRDMSGGGRDIMTARDHVVAGWESLS